MPRQLTEIDFVLCGQETSWQMALTSYCRRRQSASSRQPFLEYPRSHRRTSSQARCGSRDSAIQSVHNFHILQASDRTTPYQKVVPLRHACRTPRTLMRLLRQGSHPFEGLPRYTMRNALAPGATGVWIPWSLLADGLGVRSRCSWRTICPFDNCRRKVGASHAVNAQSSEA